MKTKDLIQKSVAEFHMAHSTTNQAAENEFKRTMTFYFSYSNHAYLKAISEVYNVPITVLGTEFFEVLIPTIVGSLPEDYADEVIARAEKLMEEFLEEKTGIREASQMDIENLLQEKKK